VRRTIEIVALTTAAIVWLELTLDVPLYRWLQPAILTPAEGAAVSPPLLVQWDGPAELSFSLVASNAVREDLGPRRSPFELTSEELPASGTYRLEARSSILGSLIQAERRFSVREPRPSEKPSPPPDPQLDDLRSSLTSLSVNHERTQSENAALHEENAGLREENAVLLQEIERLARVHEEALARASAHQERQSQLAQENQVLSEELTLSQWRLNAALACTVWGYYSYPRPQTIPPTRRTVSVSDTGGRVFRSEAACEAVRRNDPRAASTCFCVGTPLGG
jgi:hypothetical protein